MFSTLLNSFRYSSINNLYYIWEERERCLVESRMITQVTLAAVISIRSLRRHTLLKFVTNIITILLEDSNRKKIRRKIKGKSTNRKSSKNHQNRNRTGKFKMDLRYGPNRHDSDADPFDSISDVVEEEILCEANTNANSNNQNRFSRGGKVKQEKHNYDINNDNNRKKKKSKIKGNKKAKKGTKRSRKRNHVHRRKR